MQRFSSLLQIYLYVCRHDLPHFATWPSHLKTFGVLYYLYMRSSIGAPQLYEDKASFRQLVWQRSRRRCWNIQIAPDSSFHDGCSWARRDIGSSQAYTSPSPCRIVHALAVCFPSRRVRALVQGRSSVSSLSMLNVEREQSIASLPNMKYSTRRTYGLGSKSALILMLIWYVYWGLAPQGRKVKNRRQKRYVWEVFMSGVFSSRYLKRTEVLACWEIGRG